MKAEYYKEYYHLERKNWWFLARKELLKQQIELLFKGNKGIRILNVGAALGASTLMLQEFGEVSSLEYDRSCCEFVKKELGMDFINGSITELPFPDGGFDLVCAFDVVEHVENDRLAISELHRVCKPGGYIFTTVPAFQNLWSEHDEINEHFRRYTMKRYLSLFSPLNSAIVYRSYFNFWLFPPIFLVRIISRLFRKKGAAPRSDFAKTSGSEGGVLSGLLFRVFKSESIFLNRHISLPVGVSLMVLAQKQ
ncbi:methyltransferase domain-containing protein [Puia sp. P3]|uniref:class I SAM-dependent methyltransferase n=1 Tax=Puia sp. P3 TaxID=3423952 RepID=UPI003D66B31C